MVVPEDQPKQGFPERAHFMKDHTNTTANTVRISLRSDDLATQTIVDQLNAVVTRANAIHQLKQEQDADAQGHEFSMNYWKRKKIIADLYHSRTHSDLKALEPTAARAISNALGRLPDEEANLETRAYAVLNFNTSEEFNRTQSPDRKNDLPYELELVQKEGTPVTILAELATSRHIEVREAIADNPATPYGILLSLALGDSVDLRYYMAENHNLPEGILLILMEDDNPYVADRADRTMARLRLEGESAA